MPKVEKIRPEQYAAYMQMLRDYNQVIAEILREQRRESQRPAHWQQTRAGEEAKS